MRLLKSTTTSEFVEAAMAIHGSRYDYGLFEYAGQAVKSTIICTIHGEFQQSPYCHLRKKHGCPHCGLERIKQLNPGTGTIGFINKAILVHGLRYNYSEVDYTNNRNKVAITCKIHGNFYQAPANHLSGQGCPSCAIIDRANRIRKDVSRFLSEASCVHDNFYEYNKQSYIDDRTKISIICPKHGPFIQLPNSHLNGRGCPHCAVDNISASLTMSFVEFMADAIKVHGHKYIYDQSSYSSAKDRVLITCPEHGEFYQVASYHLSGYGCNRCHASKGQLEIENYIRQLTDSQILFNDRTIIAPLELDIIVPEYKLAIEYHGLYWHSFDHTESTVERNKHVVKANRSLDAGYRLIQIYESEFIQRRSIIESVLRHAVGVSKKIMARRCTVTIMESEDRRDFFNTNHIQGDRCASIAMGLVNNGRIVAAISFIHHRQYDYEIARFANLCGCVVVGGLAKLFSAFTRNYSPKTILTYSDRRFFNGAGYQKLGFRLLGTTGPGYCYIKGSKIFSRQSFQKHKLAQRLASFDPRLTEAENMFANKYRRIWDAGHYRFVRGI